MRILNSAEVAQLLDMPSCIDAVEEAFRARGAGRPAASASLGLPLDGGTLHAKLARLDRARSYVAAKINANLPRNPTEKGLPTIQGVLVLMDAEAGVPLAIMDSAAITTLRTAATSAVAARYLALPDASRAAFIGCGVQARAHLSALRAVRPITRAFAVDSHRTAAEQFCEYALDEHGVDCALPASLREATRNSQIIVTTTPSERPVLHRDDVAAGAFIAAVGADNEHKQEIDPHLLAAAAVVVDDLEQCAHGGDLRHALAALVMQLADVRGSLDQVVGGTRDGRRSVDEIIVFDSTGVAIEDVAAAALVFERASAGGIGIEMALAGR